MMEQLKVSTKSNPNSVAGAMAGVLRQNGAVEVQVVGAGALNQAIKAVAIARGYVASGGLDLVCVPSFADIEIDGERRTAIRLVIEDRERRKIDPAVELPDVDLTGHALDDPVNREQTQVAPPANGARLN
jgi:stage V sporulation protein S